MDPWPPSFTATGKYASVVELSLDHNQDLMEAAADGELYRLWYTAVPKPLDIRTEIERRLSLRTKGTMLPFAILDASCGKAAGMTTYMNIDAVNRRLEIGSTWLRKSAQRTLINTDCKFLLLEHAFERLGCVAVEFRTHILNMQSRQAIERLGAKLDGILRSHMILKNGTIRDTAVYSVIASEWPTVKANLQWRLERPR